MNDLELNFEKWGKFRVGDLFECKTTKAMVQTEKGIYPYITRSAINNGLSEFVDNDEGDYKLNKKNCITIGAEGIYSFYQNKDFVAGIKVYALRHKLLNQYNALFICSILNLENYRYFYGRARILEKIKNEIINLPINNQNNPDWQFMENYIKKIYDPIVDKIKTKIEHKDIDLNIDKWESFKLKDLFKISGTKTTKIEDLEEYGNGDFPYITTQSMDNGVAGNYNYYTEKGNILTIDSAVFGFCSYQGKNFSASDHVEKLEAKFNYFNKYIGIFISTIINQDNYRYSYGRKFNQKRIKETIIKLPVNNQNNPDWQFMENYIKQLPYSDKI